MEAIASRSVLVSESCSCSILLGERIFGQKWSEVDLILLGDPGSTLSMSWEQNGKIRSLEGDGLDG